MGALTEIFQILIVDEACDAPEFTPQLNNHIASFRAAYPDAAYRMYEDHDIRRMIQASFGNRVLWAYDQMTPYAYKADLARYCVLFDSGGVYSDLSHRHFRPIEMPDSAGMVVFRDLSQHPPWAVSNSLVAARPGRSELKQVIEQIIRHAETCYYGNTPLEPTGPYLFGRVLAQSTAWPSIQFGRSNWRSRFLRFGPKPVRVFKRLPNGVLVAEKVKSGNASIADFISGGQGGNNYNQLWLRRQAWGEPVISLDADDPLLQRDADGLHGPNWPITPGRWCLRLIFMPNQARGEGAARLRLAGGGKVFLDRSIHPGDVQHGTVEIRFDVPSGVAKAAICLESKGNSSNNLQRIELTEDNRDG